MYIYLFSNQYSAATRRNGDAGRHETRRDSIKSCSDAESEIMSRCIVLLEKEPVYHRRGRHAVYVSLVWPGDCVSVLKSILRVRKCGNQWRN